MTAPNVKLGDKVDTPLGEYAQTVFVDGKNVGRIIKRGGKFEARRKTVRGRGVPLEVKGRSRKAAVDAVVGAV